MNILAIGASRNIGYLSAIRLLNEGATVTFLLRSPSTFDDDSVIQQFVATEKARLIKGDATSEEDTRRAWEAAGTVDAVIFSVGGTPSLGIKGITINPHNLVTQCMFNLLCTIPTYQNAPQPKIIAISSIGLTPSAHKSLPLLMKPLYSMLDAPHKDKLGLERVLAHCAGWTWDAAAGEPDSDITGENWQQRPGLPAPGSLKHILVVRPAWLTDGKSKADEIELKGKNKQGYRFGQEELGCYTISRADVSHFIATSLDRWNELEDKRINVGY
ncbi:NAD(P)-bd-dom domain-containing protein [Mycena indigotica]|uniref:NAD(P)-bd-dom domain-containing protein n=1 Tax=Mycena indigotica TaxID=2126181 RepID=A0A8H6WI68_9AGAR|nr:NAD(P)-bd-dom domain-containing protein [Mycena indigotica]KAF7315813.1 NAD(P)-bd-dom domain-containing protein [Mycena indigotica]